MLGYNGSRLASTVILTRNSPRGLEVWMQERVMTMRNFPGMTVFPGGGVDSRDFPGRSWGDGELWVGRSAISLARQLGVTKYKAHALLFAAVRELFEETGTLLAVDDDGVLLNDSRAFDSQRLQLESHELSLTDVLQMNKLNVHADLLHPYARWVGQSERGTWFDVFSWIAVSPGGQDQLEVTGEADDANWFPPALLLEGWRAGLVRFAPATWAQLLDLSRYSCVEDVLAAVKGVNLTPMIGDPVNHPRYREYFTVTPTDRIGKPHEF
ncbi:MULTISPECIES: NUDIX domain-containing protein [unclassified Corynebacterium]|uniref:NUDIX hydrolase n=1 Tax=unclassified Corynebacterium TaxID=2624378 RepID=UPI002A908874|nr:NUDIX domain-containing protein [Corynebacterium sp.]MDY5784747.1 NUDIX domain-containing protein [Corynebacterium sp.]